MESLQDSKTDYVDEPGLPDGPDSGEQTPAEDEVAEAQETALKQYAGNAENLPGLPNTADADADADEVIATLRRFHLDEPRAAEQTLPVIEGLLPALLDPYRDISTLRYQYPLYLYAPQSTVEQQLAQPLSDYLRDSVQAVAPGEGTARILKDNLPWIERYLCEEIDDGAPVDAPALVCRAAEALQDHLGLDESNRDQLQADLEKLQEASAADGQFLGYGPNVAIHLMVHAVQHRCHRKRQEFKADVDRQTRGLQELLDIERSKAVSSGESDAAQSRSGSAFINSAALSGMLEQRSRGSVAMPAERQQRIAKALKVLQEYQDEPVLVRFVGELEESQFPQSPLLEAISSCEPCLRAIEIFEHEAARFAQVFAAGRIAELEVAGGYDPAVHDSWFAGFNWQAFSTAEMSLVTRVVALASADHIAGEGLLAFSRLLASRIPVNVFAWVSASDNPGALTDERPFDSFRFELGYLGIGHRQAVVAQTSAARYEDLLSGFLTALDSSRTCLHLIDNGFQTQAKQPPIDAWVMASAALESRAHPFILVNPEAGDHAADRVSFAGNPQPESAWPLETFSYRNAEGEVAKMDLAFTFADYSLLIPELHEYFRMVPDGCDSANLVAIEHFLNLPADGVDRCVPFVWGVDADGVLHRVVVARILTLACRDRLNYWRTLQELAGIQNRYIEDAVEKVREEEQLAGVAKQHQLQEEHNQELETVRSETASDVMGHLVGVLMGGDLASLLQGEGPAVSAPGSAAPLPAEPATEAGADQVEPEPEAAVEEEEEEEVSFDEPWIDTMLCTTCDDCMAVNKLVFVYNDDKQAIIADPRAGSFAEMVQAAEICPAQCIHPGNPLNSDEAGLDDLIARAAPFN